MKDMISHINNLKEKEDAVILAHFYVDSEIQAIADYVGDSYYLSKIAVTVPNQTLVLCGVSFMGESAKLLNPDKTVLIPEILADCPMAHMITPEKIKQIRHEYDDLSVVAYINSTAEIKALADVCVTSSNARRVVESLPQKNVFFVPDENLGRYISKLVPEKNFILNDGFCYVHKNITQEKVIKIQEKYPNAQVLAHPECTMDVLNQADYIGSTSGIIEYATESQNKEFIICTEIGVFYELKKRNPNKVFYPAMTNQTCSGMKMITLEKIIHVLENKENCMEINQEIRLKANQALTNMLELSK
jgi:quinolinate synthase